MAHAWKACWVHALAGSNPASSAGLIRQKRHGRPPTAAWRSRTGCSCAYAARDGPSPPVRGRPQQSARVTGNLRGARPGNGLLVVPEERGAMAAGSTEQDREGRCNDAPVTAEARMDAWAGRDLVFVSYSRDDAEWMQ